MKKYLFAFILLMMMLGIGNLFADTWTEDFDSWSDGSYSGVSEYTSSDGFKWETNNSMSHSDNARSGNAIRFNDDSSSTIEYLLFKGEGENGLNGLGSLSFWYRHWDGNASSEPIEFQVEYQIGSTTGDWIAFGSSVSVTSTDYNQYSEVLNIAGEKVYFRIKSVQDKERLLIDDMTFSDYSSAVVNTSPTITNITHTPNSNITSSTTVSVTADVADIDGTIDGVELYWGTTSGNLTTSINMSVTTGNTYETVSDIPVQTDGAVVYYEIYAIDNELAETTSIEYSYTVADPQPLTADFSADITDAYVDQVIDFTNLSTGGTGEYTYQWDFDNNGTTDSTEENPTHSYSAVGTYTVKLTVNDGVRTSAEVTKTDYINVTVAPVIPTGMIISEYIEGGSNNKAIEIYNGTGEDVDLGPYIVKLGSNGDDWGNDYNMTGTLAAGDVFVISNSSSVAEIIDVTDATSNVCYFNGDDAIGLFYNSDLIDVIGEPGVDPGSAWEVAGGAGSTAEYTLVRKLTITQGTTDWSLSAGTDTNNSQWEIYPQDTFDYLGTYGVEPGPDPLVVDFSASTTTITVGQEVTFNDLSTGGTPPYYHLWDFGVEGDEGSLAQNPSFTYNNAGSYTVTLYVEDSADSPESDTVIKTEYITVLEESAPQGVLIISELCDPKNEWETDRYIEITNVGNAPVDLAGWTLQAIGNGSSTYTWILSGNLPAGYSVVCGGNAGVNVTPDFAEAGWYDNDGTWNGGIDDGAELYDSSKGLVDTFLGVSFSDKVATRNPDVTSPNSTFTSDEWTTTSIDNASESDPGFHDFDGQTLPVSLASFMALQTADNFAQLTWVTHSESGLAGYNVFRNNQDEQATAIQVNNKIIPAYNEATSATYTFTDSETEINTTYYYWLESNDFDGSSAMFGPVKIKIGHDNDSPEIVIPNKTLLKSVYPNPFNPSTRVNFYLEKPEDVRISVYNVKGQLINIVSEDSFAQGFHNIVWNGKDLSGNDCASGIYFFRMETKNDSQMVKGILMK